MLDDDDFNTEFDAKTPLQRYGLPVGGAVAVVVVGVAVFFVFKGGSGPAARPHNEPHITQIQLPPPPPPPPPPKTPPPPKKAEEAPKQREPTPQKAVVSKPTPKAPTPPASVTTSIAGPGNSGLALGNDGGGTSLGTGSGDGGGGNNDDYYSQLVRSRIEEALRRDERLRYAHYTGTIRFTLDASGAFAGATMVSYTGDDDARAEIERVIRAESTGEATAAAETGKQFTIRVSGRARG